MLTVQRVCYYDVKLIELRDIMEIQHNLSSFFNNFNRVNEFCMLIVF